MNRGCAGGFGSAQLTSCLPWHRILHRVRLDHPDDPSGSDRSRLDRRGIQREQARSVWSDQIDAEDPSRNRKGVGSNPTSGSKTAGQSIYVLLAPPALLASLIIPGAGSRPLL